MTTDVAGQAWPYLVILLMGLATYLLRAAGLWVANRFPLTPRFRRFLEYLAGSILVALVVPMAIKSGPVLTAAVVLAAAVAVTTGRSSLAIAAAILLTAGLRQFGLG